MDGGQPGVGWTLSIPGKRVPGPRLPGADSLEDSSR